jgi:uncharacterized membrane protein
MMGIVPTILQALSLLAVSLVVGAMFGIWRGYDITTFTPATFIEVHQGAVRGLNNLLPLLAALVLASLIALAFLGRGRPNVLGLYLAAALMIIAGGVVTRVFNQPINDHVMLWSPAALPDDWTVERDSWWYWHQLRLAVTLVAELTIIAAVFVDRQS